MTSGLTLDAGALIALERGNRIVILLIEETRRDGNRIAVPAGVVAQAWRGGARQAPLARLLASEHVDIIALDDELARAIGVLCGARGVSDVVDASVALVARERGSYVVTSDPDDIARLDPTLRIIAV